MGKRTLRPRSQWLVVTVTVALLIFASGLALVQRWQGATWWLVGGAAGLAAVVGGVGPLWLRLHDQRTAGAAVVRRSVRTTGRSVTKVSLDDLRVHASVVDIAYLPRPEKEREVSEHLRARRAVLIVGPSMVGKTRLAAVVVGQVLPDTPLLLPDTPTALADLDNADVTPDRQVIWLDDLERFLTSGGVTAGLIHRLGESNWLVATLRAHEWDRFQPTDQLRPPEWDVLRLFELVLLDRDRDRPAEEDLRRAVPDDDIRARIARTGIGEYVGAAQLVRDQLTVGENANPLGYALVVGAADWSRMGITGPVPARLLPRLAAARLTGRLRAALNDEDKYRSALDWATREINPTVSLLEPDNETYRVYDLVLDQFATMTEKTVPALTWQLAIDTATASELSSLGYQAFAAYDLPDIAVEAWQRAADAGLPDAMYNLSVVLEERSNIAEAERWCRRAADARHHGAMSKLGLLLEKRGDIAEAEQWWRRAADVGHHGAMSNLGVLLKMRGDVAEAEHWYRRAADVGNPEAMYNLSVVLEERGHVAEAERWYRRAAHARQPKRDVDPGRPAKKAG